ncbi:MAG: acyloxyacyl hydrolase [Alphaproteobacteria bacterium]|nr:acyloxyacyl hydrolase [Alphaproteobacteria bacterium]
MRTATVISAIATTATLAAGLFAAVPAHADDPAFLSFGVGAYDFNRKKDPGVEARLEYRHDEKFWGVFKPFVAGGVTDSSNSVFLGAGVLIDVYFGNRFVVTPSFAPHYYHGGNKKLDLDYPLEFRSQLEMAYRFDDRSRLGVAVSHYSNASLGDTNPGTETAMVYYSIPMDVFK